MRARGRRIDDEERDRQIARLPGGNDAREGHGGRVEEQPVGQIGIVGQLRFDREILVQERLRQHAKQIRILEEDHIAVEIAVIAERLGRDHEERSVLEPGDHVVSEFRRVVPGQDRDEGRGTVGSAATVVYEILEAGRAVEILAGHELDHAAFDKPDLSVLRKTRNVFEEHRIVVRIAVVRQKGIRVDEDGLILQRPDAAVVTRNRVEVLRPDLDLELQRRLGAARIDHVEGDRRRPERESA
jgi:hypothetical protein